MATPYTIPHDFPPIWLLADGIDIGRALATEGEVYGGLQGRPHSWTVTLNSPADVVCTASVAYLNLDYTDQNADDAELHAMRPDDRERYYDLHLPPVLPRAKAYVSSVMMENNGVRQSRTIDHPQCQVENAVEVTFAVEAGRHCKVGAVGTVLLAPLE